MPKRPTSKLPDHGKWHIKRNWLAADAPFATLEVNFNRGMGFFGVLNTTRELRHINEIADDKFNAVFEMFGKNSGFEAQIEDDQTLNLSFVGAVTTTCIALPISVESTRFSAAIVAMPPGEKLFEAIKRAMPLMPSEAAAAIAPLLTREAMAMMAGIAAVWAASHFFGVGEIADVVLLLTGGLMFGATALDIAQDLFDFVRLAHGAKSNEGLDKAAEHFARAVAAMGTNAVMALLLKTAPKVFRDVHTNKRGPQPYKPEWEPAMRPVWRPWKEPMPHTPGAWFYRPSQAKFRDELSSPNLDGGTDWFGNIRIATRGRDALQRTKALLHEEVHAFLTPKLQVLRGIRIQLRAGSYSRSYILRYIEEALAQARAELKLGDGNRLENLLSGLRFPVKNGYVTLASMGQELRGILQGPVIVGGVTYQVYFQDLFQE